MAVSQTMIDEILDSAQMLAQQKGYAGFSFQDVARSAGRTLSEVEQSYRTKEELMIAVFSRYNRHFFAELAAIVDRTQAPIERLDGFMDLVRHTLVVGDRMCLCGMMMAEAALLPTGIRQQTNSFTEAVIAWLSDQWRLLEKPDPADLAVTTLARLEGGMLLSRVSGDVKHLDLVISEIRADAA
ncbi:MAG TPA: hypothetical protein DDW95_13075 [Alphaproteobacteria bacterium]|nr:hypothetical protein [Alphaproteobacteria bacterium]HAM48152.1 hypothetical protein [Alphaproteobacteria bacterium]HBF99477.1 hypothetical protein [Alphaproteobacteria bacterium]HCO90180.1 hypothetical protein [Alphaproteobacteria bacterium]